MAANTRSANLHTLHCNHYLIHHSHCFWLFFQETVTMQTLQAHQVLNGTPFPPFLLHIALVLFKLPSFGVHVFASKFIAHLVICHLLLAGNRGVFLMPCGEPFSTSQITIFGISIEEWYMTFWMCCNSTSRCAA